MNLEIVFEDGSKKFFQCVKSFNMTEEIGINEVCNAFGVAQSPTEGKLFKVNPLEMDRSKFKEPMSDSSQEETRQIILRAFAEVDKNPAKYGYAFYTMIPEKKWDGPQTGEWLEMYATDLIGSMTDWESLMTDWFDQSLEWAQRICNGESWESICNNADTAKWRRLIKISSRAYLAVGGSSAKKLNWPATDIFWSEFYRTDKIKDIVPSIALKKVVNPK